jgi:acyl-coenzyme A thioesterase PaaI-like protein
MTDVAGAGDTVPGRLGVSAHLVGDTLRLELTPRPEVLHHGVVRASALTYVIDAAAGISVDDDPDVWTLTTDLSVRMLSRPAPAHLGGIPTIVRRGRRSVTSTVDLSDETGALVATGAIGFATVARREGDPPKPRVTPARAAELFDGVPALSQPLRDEAGIEVLDAASGVVQVQVTPELRNPAGTLQGAMVALLAEAAAEDLVAARFGTPAVVTDLDLRYLAKASEGPVRTRSRLLGEGPGAPVEVELVDTSVDRVTTLAYARAQPVDAESD